MATTIASVEQQALDRVNPDSIVELASNLIRIPSFKTEESEVARWLAKYLEARGYEVDLQEVEADRFQTIARLRGSGGGKSLMFNGHIDIDPLAYGWKREPFTPTVENGRLYGAGLGNMKGGVASMISAVEAIREAGIKLKGDIVLACVAGELQGGVGTVHLMKTGLRTDMAIVAEPFGAHNVITTHSGWTQMAISTIGFSEHVTRKRYAIDAMAKMMKVIEALKGVRFRYTPRQALPDMPILSVGCIIGGRGRQHDLKGPNFISDYCTILVDVRFLPGQTPDTVREDIIATLDQLKASDPELEYEVEHPPAAEYRVLRVHMEPFDVPISEPIVQSVITQYKKLTNNYPSQVGVTVPLSCGGDDNCHLWKAGIPSLLYGPQGFIPTQQEPEDCMLIDEMTVATKVMVLTALDICNR